MSLGTPTRLHTARACRVRSNYNYSQSIALIFSFISRPDGVSYPDMMCKPSSLSPSYFQHHPSKMARFRQKYMSWRGFHSGQGTKRWKREIRPLPCWFFIIIFLGLRIFLCATVSSLTVKGTTYWGRSASGRNEQERVELFYVILRKSIHRQKPAAKESSIHWTRLKPCTCVLLKLTLIWWRYRPIHTDYVVLHGMLFLYFLTNAHSVSYSMLLLGY